MTSPFVPSSFMYGDLPQGGQIVPMIVAGRNPSNTVDTQYAAGYLWLSSLNQFQIVAGVPVYGSGNLYYQAGTSAGVPNWVLLADLAGPVEVVLGTANQITVVTAAGTATISLPAAIITPGSLTTTTSLAATTTVTAGTGITATTGNIVASTGNITATLGNIASSAGSVSAATTLSAGTTITAGTGITATTGNIAASSGNVSASGTVTGGTGVTATTGNITASSGNVSASGSVTGGTSVTATTGNITATNGNIVLGTAGNKQVYTSVATTTTAGANSAGTVTLVGGTATIATTAIAAGSKVRLTRQSVGATGANPLGLLSIGTITAGVSFVINAWSSTDATALAATDVSSIFWEVVN